MVKKLKSKVRTELKSVIIENKNEDGGKEKYGLAKVKLTDRNGKKLKAPSIKEVYAFQRFIQIYPIFFADGL